MYTGAGNGILKVQEGAIVQRVCRASRTRLLRENVSNSKEYRMCDHLVRYIEQTEIDKRKVSGLPTAIFFAKLFFTMFPNGNSRRITVKVTNIVCSSICVYSCLWFPDIIIQYYLNTCMQISVNCLTINTYVSKKIYMYLYRFEIRQRAWTKSVYSAMTCMSILNLLVYFHPRIDFGEKHDPQTRVPSALEPMATVTGITTGAVSILYSLLLWRHQKSVHCECGSSLRCSCFLLSVQSFLCKILPAKFRVGKFAC